MAAMVLTTHHGLEVKARRRLAVPGAFEKMLEELSNAIQQKENSGQPGPPTISDLDISQNKLSYEQFEALFTQLGAHNVRVLRFRLFGCPTLNDDVARVLGDYIRLLTKENAPTEMHLSDCAITTEGFLTFMSAFEETELYPLPSGMRFAALYLRLENNYISEAAIQEKVDLGVIKPFIKGRGSRASDGSTKVDLVVRDAGKYQQKQGEPPAPEDAPPPKQVHDKYSWDQEQQQQQGGAVRAGGWQQANWQPGQQNWAHPGFQQPAPNSWGAQHAFNPVGVVHPMQSLPGMQAMGGVRPGFQQKAPMHGVVRPGFQQVGAMGGARPFAAARPAGAIIQPRITAPAGAMLKQAAPAGAVWPRGSAGTANVQDRSRTPVGRTNGAAARPPAGPPPAKKGDMPHPWEEHWSDEYQIPYFWNSVTGDALWEKPKF